NHRRRVDAPPRRQHPLRFHGAWRLALRRRPGGATHRRRAEQGPVRPGGGGRGRGGSRLRPTTADGRRTPSAQRRPARLTSAMPPAIRALFFGAGLALAAALHPAPVHAAAETAARPAVIQPADIDRRVREITEQPGALEPEGVYLRTLFVLTMLLAGIIFISGADDTFVDACYWLRRLGRRKNDLRADSAELRELLEKPQAHFAIMVPAW